MLFRKDIEPRCAYCTRSAPLDDDSLLCAKKGVVYGRNLPSENKKPSFAALGGILQGVPCQNMPDMLQ